MSLPSHGARGRRCPVERADRALIGVVADDAYDERGGSPAPDIEIYKLCVDAAERSIDRRIEASKFFLTLVAGIFVACAFLLEDKLKTVPQSVDLISTIAHWTLPVLLLIVSFTWFLSIRAFRSIGTAKYGVISEMEQQLPQRPFLAEWETRHVRVLTRPAPLPPGRHRRPGVPAYSRYAPLLWQQVGSGRTP